MDEDEKRFMRKQIVRLEGEMEHFRWLERYNDLMLGEGLYRNYMEKRREFGQIKGQIVMDIQNCHSQISILLEQIDKGVEVKPVPPGVG